MFKKLNSLLKGVSCNYVRSIKLNEQFIDFAGRFANDLGTVILLSDNHLECGKYNILGYKPWLTFYGKFDNININIDGKKVSFKADPLETIRELLKICKINNRFKCDLPIITGLMGYLAYDLKNSIEKLNLTTIDDLQLPDICFFAHSVIVVHSVLEDVMHLFISSNALSENKLNDSALKSFNKKIKNPVIVDDKSFYNDKKGFTSNFKQHEYINSVEKILYYILEGDVYQVNMSQRFNSRFKGSSYSFFKRLYNINPAPFFSYINSGDYQIISSSPERLIMRKGEIVETRPIKGTRPRGISVKSDLSMKQNLLKSHKDDAELSMIVDLMRNDLGKVCKKKSVVVKKHKSLEAYHNVYHLVSIIEGKLDKSKDSVDLIKSVFPGGSITGCPKIRAMEIIDELETNCRHVYTGSIGYISFHETMDLSIAIRTATVYNDQVYFSVGGGIVYDSDPDDEFNETMHKGRTIIDSFNKKNIIENNKIQEYLPFVWFNGIIKPLKSVGIAINDLGVMYGYGFFETLLIDKGSIYFLEAHVKRFYSTWKQFFKTHIPNLSWNEIINQVINANKANEKYTKKQELMMKKKNKQFFLL
jgi:para-aminobenzoate synthetase component 1